MEYPFKVKRLFVFTKTNAVLQLRNPVYAGIYIHKPEINNPVVMCLDEDCVSNI